MGKKGIIFVVLLLVFVLGACDLTNGENGEEKNGAPVNGENGDDIIGMPEVFEEIASYDNEDVEFRQFLGPTVDQADKEAFIAWLESEGFTETDEVWDFSVYGHVGERHFESADTILSLDVFIGESIMVLTTMEAFTKETLVLPAGYPASDMPFDHDEMREQIEARLFVADYPPAIFFYNPMFGYDDMSVYVYNTKSDIPTLLSYFETILEADGFTIDDSYHNEEDDYGYLFAERDLAVVEILLSVHWENEAFVNVEVNEADDYYAD